MGGGDGAVRQGTGTPGDGDVGAAESADPANAGAEAAADQAGAREGDTPLKEGHRGTRSGDTGEGVQEHLAATRRLLIRCAGARHYAVRHLAARALTAFVSSDQVGGQAGRQAAKRAPKPLDWCQAVFARRQSASQGYANIHNTGVTIAQQRR
jgi:hypothetical protein